jgi:hypothetical protein
MRKTSRRETQDRALREDVQSVLAYRDRINARTHGATEGARILGIVAAGNGAENFLPYTIPKIVRQISETGKGADIVIGLNNGFECPMLLQRLPFLPDARVVHLYTEEKRSTTTPARVFADRSCEGEPYRLDSLAHPGETHRVFVVHQRAGPHAAGKIRVLGDIYGSLLLDSLEHGWIPPGILITFDAESQFLVAPAGTTPDPESNGLRLLIGKLQDCPEIDILGARPLYAVYRRGLVNGIDALLPDFHDPVPPIPWFLSAAHGRYPGYRWKPGGGTAGRSDVMMSLLVAIATKYPGARTEDVQLSVLAERAGLRGEIFPDVGFTNHVPSVNAMTTDDPPQRAWIQQMSRWIAGGHALERHYGRQNVGGIVSTGFPWPILADLPGFRRRLKETNRPHFRSFPKRARALWAAFVAFHRIKKQVAEHADLLEGPQATGSW